MERMKAKGIDVSLFGKTLLGQRAAAELSDEELEGSQPEVPRERNVKKTLTQQGSMADFAKLKSKERQQKGKQSNINEREKAGKKTSTQQKDSNFTTTELPVSRDLGSSPHEVQREKDNQSKHLAQQVQPQKKKFSPGSVTRYLTMQQQKTKKGTNNEGQSNEANLTIMQLERPANTSDFLEQLNEDHNLSNDEMDFENTDDENTHQIVADAPDAAAGNENEATEKKKKHRGKPHLVDIHMQNLEQRDVIIFNDLCQPAGPSADVVKKFNRFLGTLARNPTLAPVNVLSWHYMPAKDRIWEYVQSKYIVPEVAKDYVLKDIGIKWRDYKTKLKKAHFSMDATWDDMLANRPKDIPECQFKDLLEFWSTQEAQDMSQKNKGNREKQSDLHTLGPTTIALLREEMKQNDPEKRCPTQADLYIEPRKRKVGRTYSTPYDETQQNIEKMKELQSLNGGDPYYEVIREKEHSGRLRMYGHGVTQSSLKKKDPMKPYIVPSMLLDSIAAEVDKKVKEQLAEEVNKRVKEKLDAEVDKRLEERFASFLSKIRAANPGVDLHLSDSANDEGGASSSFQN